MASYIALKIARISTMCFLSTKIDPTMEFMQYTGTINTITNPMRFFNDNSSIFEA